jgi:proline racemase
MHNEGYSTMCGHGIIALTTVLLETGMHPAAGDETRIGYDTPAGFVAARAQLSGGRVLEVAFENVASFVYADALAIRLSHGTYRVPVVFGGAFYALAEAGMVALDTRPEYVPHLVEFGMDVKHALDVQHDVVHPLEPGLRGIYGTILTDDEPPAGADGRNVTVFADGEVDRSPCGTGTAGRLAWLYKRGQLGIGEPYVHEGVTGTRFTGRVLRETTVGSYPAIVPEIAGRGFLTGMHTFVVEPDDPTAEGFLVR